MYEFVTTKYFLKEVNLIQFFYTLLVQFNLVIFFLYVNVTKTMRNIRIYECPESQTSKFETAQQRTTKLALFFFPTATVVY